MNIVVYTNRGAKPRSFNLGGPLQLCLALVGVVALTAVLLAGGYAVGVKQAPSQVVAQWEQQLTGQQHALEAVRAQAEADLNALAARLGGMQAHITRMDALGSRLVAMADIDEQEFNFTHTPALGGPSEVNSENTLNLDSLELAIASLESELNHRDAQLSVLENVLTDENLKGEVYPAGRPIEKGWLSSYYGWRTNPFGGNQQFHKGLDFAGKEDSKIIAVGGGVVTWSGRKYGYGNLVEINHGNGYVTRYGHNKLNEVKVGQAVKKGEVIALMGSTGRSTGPHVHFEVIKDGRQIDPVRFIQSN